ncbi:MAG: PTS sugar transporter subunit IIB [Erysipelotrichia bacterium]|nr:PTS sugar transporter subunit IIB [Erysipelotrichia bacterium]
MIKLFRIDDRLLHGQVAFAWTKTLGIDTIYVVNDKLAVDEITKMTLNIAKPRGTKLSVLDVASGIEEIKKHVKDRTNVMIIVNNVFDAKEITDGVNEIKTINFGGIHEIPGSQNKRFSHSVCLTYDDIDACKKMAEKGIELEIRAVPEDKKNLLNGKL